jgi:uncharacterized membrane protein YgcG
MNVNVHNNESILSHSEVERIQTVGAKWPFNAEIVVETSFSKPAFEAEMKGWVQTPTTVAIGVDPKHHFTITRFGNETGIVPEQWNDIAKSGDPLFKQGKWADGLIAIGARAEMSHEQAKAAPFLSTPQATVIVPPRETHMDLSTKILFWSVGLFGAVAVAILAFNAWRAHKKRKEFEAKAAEAARELEEKQARTREEKEWHEKFKETVGTPGPVSAARQRTSPPAPVMPRPAPPAAPAPVYAAPAQQTVVVQGGGGSGDLATGYLIGSMSARRDEEVVHRHEHRYEPPSPPSYRAKQSTPTYGGSKSSSDDSGGSSSGWGGGSSDIGGGGSDFGGGGFDSGGGGSDF